MNEIGFLYLIELVCVILPEIKYSVFLPDIYLFASGDESYLRTFIGMSRVKCVIRRNING